MAYGFRKIKENKEEWEALDVYGFMVRMNVVITTKHSNNFWKHMTENRTKAKVEKKIYIYVSTTHVEQAI